MFIERLVSVGKALLLGGMNSREILEKISDFYSQARFYESVLIFEIDVDNGKWAFWGRQEWCEKEKQQKKKNVNPNPQHRALCLPFVWPDRGNKRMPQGCYAVPVYPVSKGHVPDLAKSRKEVLSFLEGRLKRTINLPPAFKDFWRVNGQAMGEELRSAFNVLLQLINQKEIEGEALVVFLLPQANGPFSYFLSPPLARSNDFILVGESKLKPGNFVVAHLPTLEKMFWLAKAEEGKEKGQRDNCSLCGQPEAISAYCKAWPWLAPTWDAPLSQDLLGRGRSKGKVEGKTAGEVEGEDLAAAIGGLCKECYAGLVIGANLFGELSATLPLYLTKELFAPVVTDEIRDGGRRNQAPVYGCAIIIPFITKSGQEEIASLLADGVGVMRTRQCRPEQRDRFLTGITGFEAVLPEELVRDDFRLCITYYSGNVSQGDIHLLALIEDVMPSVAKQLLEILIKMGDYVAELRSSLKLSAEIPQYWGESLFQMLLRAYGGPYLWHVLRRVLHCQPIDLKQFWRGTVQRLNGLAKHLTDTTQGVEEGAFIGIKREIFFTLTFCRFYELYSEQLLAKEVSLMSDWREVLDKVSNTPVEELVLENVSELGMAAGYIIREFSRRYWRATAAGEGENKKGKDFVKQKLVSFGADLNPDTVWRRGLSRLQEYAFKWDIKLDEDFRQRAAVVESEFRRQRELVLQKKDEFMAAFWSGYALHGIVKSGQGKSEAGESEADDKGSEDEVVYDE